MPPIVLVNRPLKQVAPETIDSMTLHELVRRACHATALLEQAEALLPGLARLGLDDDLPRYPARNDRDASTRRAVLDRLAGRAGQLGARLSDAAWCIEQQARTEGRSEGNAAAAPSSIAER